MGHVGVGWAMYGWGGVGHVRVGLIMEGWGGSHKDGMGWDM